MRKSLTVLLAPLLLLAAYLAFWPVPVEPVAWSPPQDRGYTGPHAANTRLAGLSMVDIGGNEGPEHVAEGPDGRLYAAVLSGGILRMEPGGDRMEPWANTGGRVLGFDFDASGNLIAADAYRGLLSVAPDGAVTVLADTVTVDGKADPIRYADAAVVAPDGTVYLTDASRRFGAKEWGGTFEASVLDILEQSATGRVLAWDPATRAARVVMEGLSFANGLALSADGSHLFVNETGRYRVWKVPVAALAGAPVQAASPPEGVRPLLENLPGFPDNLMRGRDGLLWLGFAKPRSPVMDGLAQRPALRAATLRLPRVLWPVPKAYGHVIAFDEEGRILHDLQDPTGAYPETTSVTETADRLYVQSLHAKALGWLPRSALERP
ncbi:MAG TPA: SMP-30/gluconolactonase/LRE family protein [Azospirillaceae bacterium]|nr:SMP-30/gluconolactonase/LRE family protein [Azospirillaceae bacterium]